MKPTLPENKEDRLHWARVLKKIKEGAISEIELARYFKVELHSNEIEYALMQLDNLGKIRRSMGYYNKMLCRVVEAV